MPTTARPARQLQSGAIVPVQLLQLLTPAHSGNLLIKLLLENRGWREFARLPNKRSLPDAKMLHQFRERLDLIKLRQVNRQLLTTILAALDPARKTVAIIDATDLPAATNCFKKSVAIRTALHAAVGARTVKSGQSRWFVGYKKHTLRLWVGATAGPVLLAPLISWAAPGNRCDVLFLEPSLRYCHQQLGFTPDLIVGDLAYISVDVQRRLREQFHVGVVTPLKRDFELCKAAETGLTFRCRQGQKLEWLGLNEVEQLHWFGVRDPQPICNWCWEQGSCPREFAFAPNAHETVFGTVPVQSIVAQKLLGQVRKWVEASQAYEKNQLGLNRLFLNSLQLTWSFTLLADTVCLLRCRASLALPSNRPLLFELFPTQMQLDL